MVCSSDFCQTAQQDTFGANSGIKTMLNTITRLLNTSNTSYASMLNTIKRLLCTSNTSCASMLNTIKRTVHIKYFVCFNAEHYKTYCAHQIFRMLNTIKRLLCTSNTSCASMLNTIKRLLCTSNTLYASNGSLSEQTAFAVLTQVWSKWTQGRPRGTEQGKCTH